MRVFVPFDASAPKTRLEPLLSADERTAFARVMLADVLSAIEQAGGEPTVVASASVDASVPVVVDDRPLDDAINARLADAVDPVAVVMADLPLATPTAVTALFETEGEVVLAPGRGGGTNAFLTRQPAFRVDYHGASIRDHRSIAAEIGATVSEVDSYRLGTDIDEPADLAEVLLHGPGEAAEWLREQGFELTTADGRVGVER